MEKVVRNTPSSNNKAVVIGTVDSELLKHHEVYGETFYQFYIRVPRLSDSFDRLPVTISERLLGEETLKIGQAVEVNGQFRSYNNYSADGNRLLLTVFAREYKLLCREEAEEIQNPNTLTICGYLCKKPVYRTTPFGREICDLLVAVNRAYNKSDYLPCIAWGRNARFCEKLLVGTPLKILGRIQSREYLKHVGDEEIVKTAYEISISKLEIAEESEEARE